MFRKCNNNNNKIYNNIKVEVSLISWATIALSIKSGKFHNASLIWKHKGGW